MVVSHAQGFEIGKKLCPLLIQNYMNLSYRGWGQPKMGESWLLTPLGIESEPVLIIVRVFWLLAMVGFVVAGLGVLGVPVIHEWRWILAIVAVAISLLMISIYFHPFYIIGIALDIGILVTLLSSRWLSTIKLLDSQSYY